MALSNPRKPKVAIACQGGGSQMAFTAGALKALAEQNGASVANSRSSLSSAPRAGRYAPRCYGTVFGRARARSGND